MKPHLQRTFANLCFVSSIASMGLLLGVQLPSSAQDWRICRQYNESFDEVYAFATANYYINICESNGQYYYIGQSRWDERKLLNLPAQQVGTGYYYAQNGEFNYSTADLRGVTGAPGEFKLTVTRRYSNDHVDIIIQEFSVRYTGGEDPNTMCNPVVESC